MSTSEVIERGRRVVRLEREALEELESRIDERFAAAVDLISRSRGRVIVAGMGKSGHIGRKIAATLTSTGTPATVLSPADAVHGDLGLVGPDDVLIMISKSGETSELISLLQHVKLFGPATIALTGNVNSTLARHSDVVLDVTVREEACPHDLAPTTSTTAALALGDALAVALLQAKGFRREDFARLHPGGSLGRQLVTRTSDVMVRENLPLLPPEATMRQAVVQLAERRGIVVVVDETGRPLGVVTAGDFTRLVEHSEDIFEIPLHAVMTPSPKLARDDELASGVVHRMEKHGIIAMPVVDGENAVVGVVHLHDLMRAGVA